MRLHVWEGSKVMQTFLERRRGHGKRLYGRIKCNSSTVHIILVCGGVNGTCSHLHVDLWFWDALHEKS